MYLCILAVLHVIHLLLLNVLTELYCRPTCCYHNAIRFGNYDVKIIQNLRSSPTSSTSTSFFPPQLRTRNAFYNFVIKPRLLITSRISVWDAFVIYTDVLSTTPTVIHNYLLGKYGLTHRSSSESNSWGSEHSSLTVSVHVCISLLNKLHKILTLL